MPGTVRRAIKDYFPKSLACDVGSGVLVNV